jgi:hypothetical protein
VGFGSATRQLQVLRAPFQQVESSSVREFESFQTVSELKFSEVRIAPILLLLLYLRNLIFLTGYPHTPPLR